MKNIFLIALLIFAAIPSAVQADESKDDETLSELISAYCVRSKHPDGYACFKEQRKYFHKYLGIQPLVLRILPGGATKDCYFKTAVRDTIDQKGAYYCLLKQLLEKTTGSSDYPEIK